MIAVVQSQSQVGAVGQVLLCPPAPHLVQPDATCPGSEVSESGGAIRRSEPQLATHHVSILHRDNSTLVYPCFYPIPVCPICRHTRSPRSRCTAPPHDPPSCCCYLPVAIPGRGSEPIGRYCTPLPHLRCDGSCENLLSYEDTGTDPTQYPDTSRYRAIWGPSPVRSTRWA